MACVRVGASCGHLGPDLLKRCVFPHVDNTWPELTVAQLEAGLEKKPGFKKKASPVFFFVFLGFWCFLGFLGFSLVFVFFGFFYIFAQKRKFLGFFSSV